MKHTLSVALCLLLLAACDGRESETVIRFPASAVGAEAEVLELQVARFMAAHPEVRVELRRTPDAADQRHQLYVQWLNAGAGDPDILQLDVIWTPEFAAAGSILPLGDFGPDVLDMHAATLAANYFEGRLYALPWFVDVPVLVWRKDLLEAPPETFKQLNAMAADAMERAGLPWGFVWQGARYEGLVTVFLEHLGGYGGTILDAQGRVAVDAPAAVAALTFMRDSIYRDGVVPEAALTWHEEETRFAFQNGRAVFMRNWPYALALLAGQDSAVAGRFGVASMPAAAEGRPTATLGGQQLAINSNSEHPAAAWLLIDYLTRPEQMLERAHIAGQLPARQSLYADPRLAEALGMPRAQVDALRAAIEQAVPRPVTPVYTELSQLLQEQLHRALTRQAEPAEALGQAAKAMQQVLDRSDRAGRP